MAYIKKEWILKNSIEVEKNRKWNYGAPGMPRTKKKKATREEIKRQNEWNAIKTLRRIINNNFEEDDHHLILTYNKDERPTIEESKKELKKFLTKLRRKYKVLGHELKYIITTEWQNKAIHHHLIINNIIVGNETTTKIVRSLWEKGRPKFVPLDDTGEYKDLAEYIIKETSKTFREPDNPNKLRYSRSRNLIIPKPKTTIIRAKEWLDEPREIKGYYLDKDSLKEGINPVTGYKYQHYTLKKIKKRGS